MENSDYRIKTEEIENWGGSVSGIGGEEIEIKGIVKTMEIQVKIENRKQKLCLTNVKTLDKCSAVLSVRQLCANNNKAAVIFTQDQAYIYKNVEDLNIKGN